MAETAPAGWSIVLAPVGAAGRTVFEDVLAEFAEAVASFETAAGWRVTGYGAARPAEAELTARLAAAAARMGDEPPRVAVEPVADRDWVRAAQERFPPVEAGCFFVHGAHHRGAAPQGKIAIRIDAGAAFGAGAHESTRGCLLALTRGAGAPVGAALDLGTGSGILAIALAKLHDARVVAADDDPTAVTTARANAAANGVASRVSVVASRGFRNPALRAGAPYDLIAANLFVRPLVRMAPTLARHLAVGGRAVLSGLLVGQERRLRDACGRCGCAAADRIALGDWLTLTFERRR